jgi:hypothetical protein
MKKKRKKLKKVLIKVVKRDNLLAKKAREKVIKNIYEKVKDLL